MPLSPFIRQDRPHRVIQHSGRTRKAVAEGTFLNATELHERGAAPGIRHGDTALEPSTRERLEREVDDGRRAIDERSGTPKRGVERETDFRRAEAWLNRPQLEQARGMLLSARHHCETEVAACPAFASNPRDEPRELLHRFRPNG